MAATNSQNLAKYKINGRKITKGFKKFGQSGEISPSLVTLLALHSILFLKWVNPDLFFFKFRSLQRNNTILTK